MLELADGCLTCFQHPGANFLNIESKNNSTVCEVLRKHFWFTEVHFQRAVICQSCWEQVNHFHRFYVSVEELHQHQLVSSIVKSEPKAEENVAQSGSSCDVCGHVCPTENALRMHKVRKHSSPTPVHPLNIAIPDGSDSVRLGNLHQPDVEENEQLVETFPMQSDNSYLSAGEVNFMERSKVYDDDQFSYNGKQQQNLKSHMLQHDRKKQCMVCSRWFKSARSWSLHMSKHHPDAQPETSCDVCGHVCPSENALRMHKSRKHSSPTPVHPFNFLVEEGNEPLQHGSGLTETEQLHRIHSLSMIVKQEPEVGEDELGEESFPILNDSVTYGDDGVLDSSNNDESELRIFRKLRKTELTCDRCSERGFKTKQELSAHKLEHGQTRQCKVCSQWLRNLNSWSLHMRKQHPNAEPDTTCDICGHVTPTKQAIRMHKTRKHGILSESGEISLPEEGFSEEHKSDGLHDSSPKVSVIVKSEPDGSNCRQTSHTTSNKHFKLQDADLSCDVCSKGGFSSKRSLYYHKLQHGQDKQCKICSQWFPNTLHWSIHMKKQHPKDQPDTTCGICGHVTPTKSALHMHMKRKHSDAYP